MSKQYDDARYGVEKFLVFPETALAGVPTTHKFYSVYMADDIYITEIGFNVTIKEVSTGNATAATLVLNKSGSNNALATLTLSTMTMSGNLHRTTTIATPAHITAGSVLQLMSGVTASSGTGVPYIKYRETVI